MKAYCVAACKWLLAKWWRWTVALFVLVFLPVVAGLIQNSISTGQAPTGLGILAAWVTNAAKVTVAFLFASVMVPRLWYWLLNLTFVVAVGYIGWRLCRTYFGSTYRDYTRDMFFDILWKWKWSAKGAHAEGDPYQIKPHCPDCNLELHQTRGYTYLSGPSEPSKLVCTDCKKEWQSVSINEVKKRIKRNAENGEWKKIVARRPPDAPTEQG